MMWYKVKNKPPLACEPSYHERETTSHWLLNAIVGGVSATYTFVMFTLACCSIPWLFLMYLVVRICRIALVYWLGIKFKGLEFVKKTTARTAIDTRRNQGIITVLLKINGDCQLPLIKNRIQEEIIEKRTNGRLVYPHMKKILTSRWGNYAWIDGSDLDFDPDNHIVLASPLFKGRNVTDSNIQEYVSDIIAKMLPPELPPWQITLIPSQEGKTYLLIRLHHLYLSEDHLSLGSLLLIQPEMGWQNEGDGWENTQHVLAGVFQQPVVIPQVYQHLCENFSNWWNEILSAHDPLGNPFILKSSVTVKTFLIRLLISMYAAMREYSKSDEHNLIRIFYKERKKRGVGMSLFVESLATTFHPGNLVVFILIWVYGTILTIIRLPLKIFYSILDTPVYLYWLYLLHFVIKESVYIFKVLYSVPRVLFEEIVLPEHPRNVHQLQTLSVCGRKSVSWSPPVPLTLIKQIKQASGASTSDIIMSAATMSLRNFFQTANFQVPDAVMTTCHFMPQEHLLLCTSHSSGMLCLPLPTKKDNKNPLENLRALQHLFYNARAKQAALYLASKYQLDYGLFTTLLPTLLAKACLYLLSRRYAVTVTQIDSTMRGSAYKTRQLLWGQDVESVMYWRPPQANVCLSMTLISYGEGIRLGVMVDGQLSPHHNSISESFGKNIEALGRSLGVRPEYTH